jgi:hypothetical protein
MLAEIGIGPAVEAAVAHRGHIVGHEVRPDLVSLVDRDPQSAVLGVPRQTVGVAQARREDAHLPRGEVDLQHRRAVLLHLHAVLADIAVGAGGGVELRPVPRGDQILGPVVVERPGGQVGNLLPWAARLRRASFVAERDDRVRIRDVEAVADQRHAEGRIEPFDEGRAELGDAVAVGVAQQRDAVGAFDTGARETHHDAFQPAAQAAANLGRAVRLGHKHVAVGQDVQPSRMVEPAGEFLDRQPLRGHRRNAFRPRAGAGEVERGDQRGLRIGQSRVRTVAGLHRHGGLLVGYPQHRAERGGDHDDQRQGPDQKPSHRTSPPPPLRHHVALPGGKANAVLRRRAAAG